MKYDKERLEEMVQAVVAGGSTTVWERTQSGGYHALDLDQTMSYAKDLIDLIDQETE